jgi:hypothetical protein
VPDMPYDGHTLRDVIDRTETLTGAEARRRCHPARAAPPITIGPIIGHLKAVVVPMETPRRAEEQSWLRKFEQDDKWSFCLTTAIIAVNGRDYVHPNQITAWKVQLEGGASGVFGSGSMSPTAPAIDLKSLHAKIGELTLENDFLSYAGKWVMTE